MGLRPFDGVEVGGLGLEWKEMIVPLQLGSCDVMEVVVEVQVDG